MKKVRCQTPKHTYTMDYPAAIQAAEEQMNIFWLPTEPEVEKDLHCLKTELTESELHGVTVMLRSFTKNEITIGNEYWGGRFKQMFPRPDFQRMANCFSFFEINVHAPFYARVDELLGLNTDEFYSQHDPVLDAKMDFLDQAVADKEDLYSLGVFSMVEGAVLYSSFSFMKHFQVEGKNKLTNMDSGISFSVKDENLHSEGGAWAFRILLQELREEGYYLETSEEWKSLVARLYEAADVILQHETALSEDMFSKGPIKNITANQMVHFVESRLDLCLSNLSLDKKYKPSYNPIAKWFYKSIGGNMSHDFFAKLGSAYNREWTEKRFSWKGVEVE